MGRASLGPRQQISLRLPPNIIADIDAARGPVSRDRWIERAAALALSPTAAVIKPELRQDVHRHTRSEQPIRTSFKAGQRVRVYACTGCGTELEGTG